MTLLSAVITLTPAAPVELPVHLGRAAHAWLLDRVRAHDHRLAEALHEPNAERPFTVSDVLGGRGGGRRGGEEAGKDSRRRVHQGDVLSLRLTSYEPTLTQLLENAILPGLPDTASLAGITFNLQGWTTDAAQHPWAGRATFESLVAQHTLQDRIPAQVTLHFAAPTVFKSQGVFMPLPLPRLVFEGLARRWNAFSPIQIHPDVARYADECMVISRYDLHTERVAFGDDGDRGAYSAFLGRCTYALRVRDRYWMGLIQLLGGFALYAGVGVRTTMGLGQCRALPARPSSRPDL